MRQNVKTDKTVRRRRVKYVKTTRYLVIDIVHSHDFDHLIQAFPLRRVRF